MLSIRDFLPPMAVSAGAAVFVWVTSSPLPDVVASHFDGTGSANGFMPRSLYIALLVTMVFAVPLLLSVAPFVASGRAGERLNIPNKGYWLHPDRRTSTLEYVGRHARWFGYGVVAFLSCVHWLVVRANAVHPPQLSSQALMAALAVFFVALFVWLAVFYVHFKTHA